MRYTHTAQAAEVIADLLVLGQVAEEAAVIPVEETEGLSQVVVLQGGQVIVLDGQRVAGLDQEIVVQALVVQVMADC